MDWNLAIDRNREALKRVLAALVAMAGLAIGQSPPLRGRCPAGQRGVGSEGAAGATNPTLPRHLHRAILRLLRPAESAARRLVIVAARGLVVTLPPPRRRKPKPKPVAPVLRRLGIAVVMSPADLARAAPAERARLPLRAARPLALPLVDPLRIPTPGRVRTVPAHAAPRILSFDGASPHRLPPPPSPDDPIDATRLALRLAAVGRALDDLPGHARRFARWRARGADAEATQNNEAFAAGVQDVSRRATRFGRLSPLRPGRPPGQRSASSRRPAHEIHEVLRDLQWFACQALEHPDTS